MGGCRAGFVPAHGKAASSEVRKIRTTRKEVTKKRAQRDRKIPVEENERLRVRKRKEGLNPS
jgi:hypothetical protein